MKQLNPTGKEVEQSGYILPWNTSNDVPALIYIENTLFIPVFSTPEKYNEHIDFIKYPFEVGAKRITNTDGFIESIQPYRVALDPHSTDRGTTRFTEILPSKKIKRIPINIWDDYFEDEYIPEGKTQKTHIYVEDYDISFEKHKDYLQQLLDYMQTKLELPGVEFSFSYSSDHAQIYVEYLTHERREKLVKELNSAKLIADGVQFDIYSES